MLFSSLPNIYKEKLNILLGSWLSLITPVNGMPKRFINLHFWKLLRCKTSLSLATENKEQTYKNYKQERILCNSSQTFVSFNEMLILFCFALIFSISCFIWQFLYTRELCMHLFANLNCKNFEIRLLFLLVKSLTQMIFP